MTSRLIRFALAIACLLACANASPGGAQSPAPDSARCYLFAYFVDPGAGLHLAWSEDGLRWQAIRSGGREKIFLRPTVGDRIFRDPCLLYGPDRIFRLVWTDAGGGRTIGYAHSANLLDWSPEQALPVLANEPTAMNAWAPALRFDSSSGRYLIFWSSTIPGRFPATDNQTEATWNHRFYVATTTDFATFTPATLLLDPNFCCIDATITPFHGRFYLFFKNETLRPQPAKDLYFASSPAAAGPYQTITGPVPTVPPHWIEGPTAIEIGGQLYLYYDCYSAGHYGACRTGDMRTWTDVTGQLVLPKGIRHGTVLSVPHSIVAGLLR